HRPPDEDELLLAEGDGLAVEAARDFPRRLALDLHAWNVRHRLIRVRLVAQAVLPLDGLPADTAHDVPFGALEEPAAEAVREVGLEGRQALDERVLQDVI